MGTPRNPYQALVKAWTGGAIVIPCSDYRIPRPPGEKPNLPQFFRRKCSISASSHEAVVEVATSVFQSPQRPFVRNVIMGRSNECFHSNAPSKVFREVGTLLFFGEKIQAEKILRCAHERGVFSMHHIPKHLQDRKEIEFDQVLTSLWRAIRRLRPLPESKEEEHRRQIDVKPYSVHRRF